MTIPFPGTAPDTSVDTGAQLTQGFQVMVRQLQSLERVISTQTAMLERTQNASNRYQMAGQAQISQSVLQNVAASGGIPHGAVTTQVTPMGAASSLSNLQSYTAQRIGQWIAGTPLYEMPGAAPGGRPGATPAGTPTSAGRQAGSGAPGTGSGTPVGTPSSTTAGTGSGTGAGTPAGGAPAGGTPAGGVPGGGTPGGGTPGGSGSGSGSGSPPPGGGGTAGAGTPPGGGSSGRTGLPAVIWGSGSRGGSPGGMAVLQQVGARVAMSGGTVSGISNALRSIPGVGLIADAVQSGTDFYLNQREAGRVYQEVEGGSNLDAQTERLHSLAYQASMYGLMPSGAAAQAFGSVTAMGYNQAAAGEGQQQQNRQSALNFIYHNYTGTGMDVNQSLQILDSASKDSNVNLQQLSQTLNELSAAAGQAGTNADTARQQFNSYFQAALGQGMGNGSTTVAGGISAMQGSMGKEFSGVNFSGELSQSRQYLLSGMSGISPAQLQYTARNNPGAYNQLLAGQNMQFLSEGGLMTPQMQSSLNGMIKSAGGGNALMQNPDLRDQIANQFLNQWQVKGNINENLWAQEISALTGVNMNPTQAFQWIVSQSAGVNEASHNSGLSGGASPGANVSASKLGSAPQGRYGLAQSRTGITDRISSLFEHGNLSGESWQNVLKSAGPAGSAYLQQEQKTGQRSPVLEALLQNTGSSDQVMVQTSSGQRVMSIADAMKYYPNELAAGNVEFYGSNGQAMGTTSAITHGLTNASANVTAEEKQKAGSKLGVTAAAWEKAHPAAASAGGGQAFTINLSAEAKQLLKLLPSNNDQAAATSQVPANPWPSQASR